MTRLVLCAVLALGAASASAEVIAQFDDDVLLRDHETVRYRIDVDYGAGAIADLDIVVRGFSTPPRVRVLDSNKKELKDVRDTDGDWKLDFDITLHDTHDHYFVEVDSARPGDDSHMDVLLTVSADASNAATADIFIDKFFLDFESGDASDHNDCAAGVGMTPWALLPLAGLGVLAVRRRRQAA